MHTYIDYLEKEFVKNANPSIAAAQKAYMKNHFEFFGLKADARREITKPFLAREYLPSKKEMTAIVKLLWQKEHRDFHHFAQELAFKYVKQIEKKDIELFEFMVVNQSWWDSIDYIAPKLIGAYFKKFPEERDRYVDKWLKSGNIWLQRSAILFQLKYKADLDTEFLTYVINSLLGSRAFFINKAIGWILREYGKTNPTWVVRFVEITELSNLSRREALRLIV